MILPKTLQYKLSHETRQSVSKKMKMLRFQTERSQMDFCQQLPLTIIYSPVDSAHMNSFHKYRATCLNVHYLLACNPIKNIHVECKLLVRTISSYKNVYI